jgi:hypothetical protein
MLALAHSRTRARTHTGARACTQAHTRTHLQDQEEAVWPLVVPKQARASCDAALAAQLGHLCCHQTHIQAL